MSVLDLSEYEYHYDLTGDDRPSASASILHEFVTNTAAHAKARHPKLNPELVREDATHFDIGTAAHDLLLGGPDRIALIEADSFRTKAAQQARDEARVNGQLPLLDKHWRDVQAMVASVRSHLDDLDVQPPLFRDGQPEVTLVWEDRDVLCRARLDWLRAGGIDDFKTTTSARPEKWSRTMFDHGCDIQAAFYLRGVKAAFGIDATFRFLVVEKSEPYACAVFSPAPDTLALANQKIDWALDMWKRCVESGDWPAYAERVHYVTLPPWAEGAWFDREAREQVAA